MILLSGRSRIMFGDEVLPCIRELGVIYQDGKPIKRAPLQFTILCNVQNTRGLDLLLRPEADRYSGGYRIFAPAIDGRERIDTNDFILRGDEVLHVQINNDWGSYSELTTVTVDGGPDKRPLFGEIDRTIWEDYAACSPCR